MKRHSVFLSVAAALLLMLPFVCVSSFAQSRIAFDDDWRFWQGDPEGAADLSREVIDKAALAAIGAVYPNVSSAVNDLGTDVVFSQASFDDSAWRSIDLPHDWCIEHEFQPELNGESAKLPCDGVGWYRKRFDLSPAEAGRRVYLDIDGAMSDSAVWVNGEYVGGWPYGYTSFRVDLTAHVRFDQPNVIAIRTFDPPDSSRWYTGSGIYRHVWLVTAGQTHISRWGVEANTASLSASNADVAIAVQAENHTSTPQQVTIECSIYRGDPSQSSPVANVRTAVSVPHTGVQRQQLPVSIPRPALWSPATPQLYTAVVRLTQGNSLLDSQTVRFGLRSVEYDPARGLLVNGEHVYIKGICIHHDLGTLGAAFNESAMERRFDRFKEMGANAIRMTVNPPAPEVLDMADERGFLVIDEAFDAWAEPKRKNDYASLFRDWHAHDLRAMIRRDRNHPSVIMWTSGNEIPEQSTAEGRRISAELTAIAHEEDTTRPVTSAANSASSGYDGFQYTVDVFGYNYHPEQYRAFHRANPSIPIFATESSSTISSRGEYFFPVARSRQNGLHDHAFTSDELIYAWTVSLFAGMTDERVRNYFFPELEDSRGDYT
ncbi:MAG: beta-galactosidase, partial [Acidobacteria bacterium]|nr:beta-galactosidase [Acidobacteriota bacterium]